MSDECQFRDATHLEHTPFDVRAPVCLSCFHAALDSEAARADRAESDLSHWRQAAINLSGQLDLVRATLDAVIAETTRGNE